MEKMKFGFNRFALSLALFRGLCGFGCGPGLGQLRYANPHHAKLRRPLGHRSALRRNDRARGLSHVRWDELPARYLPDAHDRPGMLGRDLRVWRGRHDAFQRAGLSRGDFLRGTDNMGSGAASRDPGAGSRTAMATGGNTGNNVGSVQTDAFQGHWHDQWLRSDVGGATVGKYGGVVDATGANTSMGGGSGLNNYVRSPISDGSSGTPRTTTETRPINGYVNYIVKI
jgi:hypothetical protein